MKSKGPLLFEDFKASIISTSPHYLVVGHPISHSLSPAMHNIALRHHSIDAEYIAVDLSPESASDFISWVNRDQFLGCNITIPWKKQLLNLPDHLSPEVKAVGAMNTISKSKGGTIISGDNTDIYGFTVPLQEYDELLDMGRAIVFGTGGSSLAVQYALMEMGYEEIVLVSRSPGLAVPLKESAFTTVVDYTQWQSFADEAELFINTTPLGMGDKQNLSPINEVDSNLLPGKICYDLVYNPSETKFLTIAEKAGAKTINGLNMLIHQGSRSFQIWTGHTFPIEKVKTELMKFFAV